MYPKSINKMLTNYQSVLDGMSIEYR